MEVVDKKKPVAPFSTAAEAATDVGSDDGDDLSLPVDHVILTFLLIIVVVVTAALIAMVI